MCRFPFLLSSSLILTTGELLSLPFVVSLSPVSVPLCLSHLSLPTFTPFLSSSPPSPSLSPTSLTSLAQHPGPSLGGVRVLPECWTPSEVAEPRAPTPSPLLPTAFSGALEEGREEKEALQQGFEMLVPVALEKGVRVVWVGAT